MMYCIQISSILRHSKRIAPFLSLEPLAKPTLNKINRRKNRLSALQFRGFARVSIFIYAQWFLN